MKCGNCGVKAVPGGIAMLNAEKDQWRCPACKAWNVIKEEPAGEQSELNAGLNDLADRWHHEREELKEQIANAIFSSKPTHEKIDEAQHILNVIDFMDFRDEDRGI